jgi:hypothetical protein
MLGFFPLLESWPVTYVRPNMFFLVTAREADCSYLAYTSINQESKPSNIPLLACSIMKDDMFRNQVTHKRYLDQHRRFIAGKLGVVTGYVTRSSRVRCYDDR